jgi:CDP-diglyceride synthetase
MACALLLLVAANSLPWLLGRLLRTRPGAALDFGLILPDGRTLFGAHKTWRGLLAGVLGCALTAALCGLPSLLGIEFGALSLSGDALSSALKRRLDIRPGTEVPGLDQLPEALLPLTLLRIPLGLDWVDIVVSTAAFALLDLLTARLRRNVAA